MSYKDKNDHEYMMVSASNQTQINFKIQQSLYNGWHVVLIERSKPFFGKEKWTATLERKKFTSNDIL